MRLFNTKVWYNNIMRYKGNEKKFLLKFKLTGFMVMCKNCEDWDLFCGSSDKMYTIKYDDKKSAFLVCPEWKRNKSDDS